MGEITVRIDGLGPLLASLEAVRSKMDVATHYATRTSGKQLQSDARHNFVGSHAPGWHHVGGANPNTVTGNLQASILSTPVVQTAPGRYSTRVGPHAIYSRVIEFGAVITPKAAKFLSWFDAQEGRQQFHKSVVIPGRPYFTPAYATMPYKMETIFALAWKQAWNG